MNYDKERLVDQLIRHEGMELKVYKDSLGIETIGSGSHVNLNSSMVSSLMDEFMDWTAGLIEGL